MGDLNSTQKRRYLMMFGKRNALGITKDDLKLMSAVFDKASLMVFLQWLKQRNWLGSKNNKLYLTDVACDQLVKVWSDLQFDRFGSVRATDVKDCFDFPVDFTVTLRSDKTMGVQANYLADRSGEVTNDTESRLIVSDWRTAKDVRVMTGVADHGFSKLSPRIDHRPKFDVNAMFG